MKHFWPAALLIGALLIGCSPSTEPASEAKKEPPGKTAAEKSTAETAAKKTKPLTLAERYQELVDQYDQSPRDTRPKPAEHAQALLDLVDEDPRSSIAADALLRIVAKLRAGEIRDEALDRLVKDYPNESQLAQIVTGMARGLPTPANQQRLQTLMENSTHSEVKAVATLAYAILYEQLLNYRGMLGDRQMAVVIQQQYGEETLNFIQGAEIPDNLEKMLEDLIVNHADLKFAGRNLGELAKRKLFVLRHLQIGKTAPNIVGKDLDGEEFELADYRGKVVLLDFWGDW